MHDIRFPGESDNYREKRNELLQAEAQLRANVEQVAAMRRALPLGGEVADYEFDSAAGAVALADLFGAHDTLLIYSFMYGADDDSPCPMCSAYVDSLNGQRKHLEQRMSVVVAARAPMGKIQALVDACRWQDVRWVSAAGNTYARDYHSEMPNGAQVPMCNVFVRRDGKIHHFWASEAFFVPWEHHPRHVDMLWPLWHYFDLSPEGRGEFMPGLNYTV